MPILPDKQIQLPDYLLLEQSGGCRSRLGGDYVRVAAERGIGAWVEEGEEGRLGYQLVFRIQNPSEKYISDAELGRWVRIVWASEMPRSPPPHSFRLTPQLGTLTSQNPPLFGLW